MQTAQDAPLRAEVIGSLLRPRALKDAAVAASRGQLDRQAFGAVLDREVANVIRKQEDIGLRVVTDGEFGRTSWFGFFFEGMEGFDLAPSLFKFKDADGHTFEWPTCVANRRISRRAPITLGEFDRARRAAQTAMPKATMPAPSAFHFFRLGQATNPEAYPDVSAYFDDLVAVYRAEMAELAAAGCRYVQFDEVPLAMLCDPDVAQQASREGAGPACLIDLYISIMQRILDGRPRTMTVGMHLCRGNFRSRWMAAGGYEPVADRLFNEMPVDVFLLEYDSERAGDFQPLRHLPQGKRAVLGMVSSKTAALEDQSMLQRRLEAAARVVPLEQLAISTQCGFASVAGGNLLTPEDQWAKLALVVETARRVWGSP
jgi:5-methyltetrahydropteroyltriglutamate--homocysteine methyltransferase